MLGTLNATVLAGTMLGHPHLLRFLLLMTAMWLDRRCEHVIAYLTEENRALREQLPRRPRFTDAQRRRLARAARNLPRKTLRELGTIVTPDTLLRWYRELVAAKYDSTASRKLGRPRTPEDLRALVLTMATENPTWGYTRIRGALLNLGHDLSCSTIARILKDEGVSP